MSTPSKISRPNNESYELKLYPLNDEFIGIIEVKQLPPKSKCETVVILDRSGSMADNVEYVTKTVLPKFFEKLSYNADDVIHLITFDTVVEYFNTTVEVLKNLEIMDRGCTRMAGAITELHRLMEKFKSEETEAVRILTISDGAIDDPEPCLNVSNQLAAFVKESEISINSQAVRLFTSDYADPDTTALCCLLQLNNVVPSNLLDTQAQEQIDIMVDRWAELFSHDGLLNAVKLQCDSQILRKNPWDAVSSDEVTIIKGRNALWIKEVPKNVKINENDVKVSVEPAMSYEKFTSILKEKLKYIVDHLKILKIIQTESGRETINNMVDYFKKVEKNLRTEVAVEEPEHKNLLSSRTSIFKFHAHNQRKLSNILAEIANDDKVGSLNAAQKAAYLRSADNNKNSRNLAKRSARATGDESFDEIARKEVLQIVEHFEEIKDINYKDHAVSFYSHATTMEGIETLVDFSKDDYFETMDVLEILKLMNIVGVACNGPIGDFPDASNWRVNKIIPGCFISFSDLMYVLDQSLDDNLKAPGFDDEITNVIPIFEDPRIAKFLKKYSPSLLEFTFSIGMRRMIAEIPMTITYTMISGVRAMLPIINEDKSGVNFEVLKKIVITLDSFAGKSLLQDVINEQTPEITSNGFFLDNLGTSDVIVPLIRIIKSNDENQMKKIPAILRSVFNYEVFNLIRKTYRGKDGESKNMLFKLLGIDVEKHKVKFEMPFDEKDAKFYDEINLDQNFLDSFNFDFLNFIALIPKYFEAVIKNNHEDIKKMPKLDGDFVLKAFEIENCTFNDFWLLNIYQALRYTTKQERCDVDLKCMKIVDLKNHREAMEEVKSYIRDVFIAEFKKEMAWANSIEKKKDRLLKDSLYFEEKLKKELSRTKKYSYDVEADKMVIKILTTSDYEEMIKLWKDGIEIDKKCFKLSAVGSSATRLFVLALRCLHFDIPLRSEIIKILTTGTDSNGEYIWKNDTLKEETVIAKYVHLVDLIGKKFPKVCVKNIQDCC